VSKREPRNPHDYNAIVVRNQFGVMLGHLSRADAAALAPALDRGGGFGWEGGTRRTLISLREAGLRDVDPQLPVKGSGFEGTLTLPPAKGPTGPPQNRASTIRFACSRGNPPGRR
jgi:hypothetical protein